MSKFPLPKKYMFEDSINLDNIEIDLIRKHGLYDCLASLLLSLSHKTRFGWPEKATVSKMGLWVNSTWLLASITTKFRLLHQSLPTVFPALSSPKIKIENSSFWTMYFHSPLNKVYMFSFLPLYHQFKVFYNNCDFLRGPNKEIVHWTNNKHALH